jgi:hypothetical protein
MVAAGLLTAAETETFPCSISESEGRALMERVFFGKAAPEDPKQDFVPPAEAEMRSLASRHHAANPHKTYEQSYAEMFIHPKNRDLAERIKAESIGRAQMLPPAKPVPAYAR